MRLGAKIRFGLGPPGRGHAHRIFPLRTPSSSQSPLCSVSAERRKLRTAFLLVLSPPDPLRWAPAGAPFTGAQDRIMRRPPSGAEVSRRTLLPLSAAAPLAIVEHRRAHETRLLRVCAQSRCSIEGRRECGLGRHQRQRRIYRVHLLRKQGGQGAGGWDVCMDAWYCGAAAERDAFCILACAPERDGRTIGMGPRNKQGTGGKDAKDLGHALGGRSPPRPSPGDSLVTF